MRNFLYNFISRCQQEYNEFKASDKYTKLFLVSASIYFIISGLYIIQTKNYYEIWLLIIVPFVWLPLFVIFLPEFIQVKKIKNLYEYLHDKNQEVTFFYLSGLIAITWIGFLWGTDIITIDYDRRITLSVQSITASLAPLAFYIAYKNYARKSGMDLIALIEIPPQLNNSTAYEPYIKKITFQNLKDKTIVITNITIIIDNHFSFELSPELHNIKAYEAIEIKFDPISFYSLSHPYLLLDGASIFNIFKSNGCFKEGTRIEIRTLDNNIYISNPQIDNEPVKFKKAAPKKYRSIICNRHTYTINNYFSIIWPLDIDYAIILNSTTINSMRIIFGIIVNENNVIEKVKYFRESFEYHDINYTLSTNLKFQNLVGKKINSTNDLTTISENFQQYCHDILEIDKFEVNTCLGPKYTNINKFKKTDINDIYNIPPV